MILVENNRDISSLVEELDLSFGSVKLDAETLEFSQTYPNELYLVQAEILQNLEPEAEAKLKQALGLISIGTVPATVAVKFPNLVYQHPKDGDKSTLRNQLTLVHDLISQTEVMKSQLITLNRELNETLGSLETELLRLKQAHARKTPKRLEEIKGVHFYSKYSAGESMGGEYFDMFKAGNKVFILMSSTSSYLASSSILTFFGALKLEQEISGALELKFLNELKAEFDKINHTRAKKIEAHIMTAILDLGTYQLSGHNLGRFKIKSSSAREFPLNNQQNTLDSSFGETKFDVRLHRSEKLLLLSPGFTANWQKLNAEFMPEDILTRPGVKSLDILDELFFQMKKDSESGFLPQDASVILLEMGSNVMVKL